MDRIIQSYMSDFLKSQQIIEIDQSKQYELFSTYCIVSQHYNEIFALNDIVVGSGNDCGIDGVAVLANGALVTSKEEIDDLIEINKSLRDVTFIFVQSKTSNSFSGSDIGTFGTGVLDFFSEQPKLVRNESIQEKSDLVEYIFNKAVCIKGKPSCLLYYVTTGKWVDDTNCSARINYIKEALRQLDLFENIEFVPVDANLIQKYYRNTIDVIEKEIDFPEKLLLPDIEKVTQSYIGFLDYNEYLKLITGENGEILKNVFYDNVRDYQGENDVNSEIANTIKEESNKFVLFNNGVTIICKKLTNLRNRFTLSDYQIVNGCQTSHVVYNNIGHISGDLQIPVKIIETADEDTVNKIVKATNRQTQVSDEQLIALNEFHRKLEAYYNTFSGNQKLYYERRSKQFSFSSDVEKVRIVSISTQIKAAAAMFLDKPHLASRYYGQLLKSIDGLFNEEHKLMPYYTCAFLLYKLEYSFRNRLISSQYRKYRYHLLMLYKYDFASGTLPELNSSKMERLCQSILDCANDNELFIIKTQEYLRLIDECVPDLTDMDKSKSALLVEQLKQKMYEKKQ